MVVRHEGRKKPEMRERVTAKLKRQEQELVNKNIKQPSIAGKSASLS